MHERSRLSTTTTKLERAIALELLSGGSGQGCSHGELQAAISAAPAELEQALQRLDEAGIVRRTALGVSPSSAVLRLDELGLIAI